jgi:hypothetical protein
MRLSADRYPEYVDFYCFTCDTDSDDVKVDSIEGEDVYVYCPVCDEPAYVRVID